MYNAEEQHNKRGYWSNRLQNKEIVAYFSVLSLPVVKISEKDHKNFENSQSPFLGSNLGPYKYEIQFLLTLSLLSSDYCGYLPWIKVERENRILIRSI